MLGGGRTKNNKGTTKENGQMISIREGGHDYLAWKGGDKMGRFQGCPRLPICQEDPGLSGSSGQLSQGLLIFLFIFRFFVLFLFLLLLLLEGRRLGRIPTLFIQDIHRQPWTCIGRF